jgi:hypothetical protein
MSDIWQQFEDWEKNEPLAAQEQPLMNMKTGPERIWPGPDSSNDPRSSENEEEESDNGGVELPAQILHGIHSQEELVIFSLSHSLTTK